MSEAVVLATCNRTEIYVKAERFHGAFEDLRDLLVDLSDVAPDRFLPHLTVLWDEEAIEHLFSVAAGLDSAVLGEVEVQGQVRQAQRMAEEEGTLGPTLELAFRHALGAGKRVRTETSIAHHTASVAQAAIEIARDRLGDDGSLEGATVAVVGAGKMATSMARSLSQAGSLVVVANRTAARERSWPTRWVAGPAPWSICPPSWRPPMRCCAVPRRPRPSWASARSPGRWPTAERPGPQPSW